MKYSQKLLELRRRFDGSKYDPLVTEYMLAYVHDNVIKMDEILKKLPTEEQLLESLVNKLKGKSVYTNLKKVINNENMTKMDRAIALSSLLTHILIECKTNKEYRSLIQDVYKKLEHLINK